MPAAPNLLPANGVTSVSYTHLLALLDESDSTVYSRVLAKPQLDDQGAFAQSLEEIRLELAVRAGNIPADLRKTLKEQDSVLNYRTA